MYAVNQFANVSTTPGLHVAESSSDNDVLSSRKSNLPSLTEETIDSKFKTPIIREVSKDEILNYKIRKNKFKRILPAAERALLNIVSRNQYMETRLHKLLKTPVISLRTRAVLRDGSGATVTQTLKRLINKMQGTGARKKKGKTNKIQRPMYRGPSHGRNKRKKQQEKDYRTSTISTTNNESDITHSEAQQISRVASSSASSTQFLCQEDIQLLEK
ncbi:uncharacterized protein LOC126267631 isoform X2 [Schistocerca gregaria]|nr:uncharacterized protein LOC126267631 isoform X2 [Schistocerca gregaria]